MTSILLVEDDAVLCGELRDFLVPLGYSVSCAGSVAEAELKLVGIFDIVVLDINLPDGDGLELCTRMRPYVRAGIVMLTGRSEREIRIQGLKGGADAFLLKPVDPEIFEATLASVQRRLKEPQSTLVTPAALPVQWRLDRIRHALTGPNGKSCKLSESEMNLLAGLLQAPGQQASREVLLTAFHEAGRSLNGRHIETMVSRLRSKVLSELGVQLPIAPIYGKGYVFSDHAQLI